jgi:hypothetical protein
MKTVKVLNTVTAGGGDLNITSAGIVSVLGGGNFRANSMKTATITAAVAETRGVITVTPTSANSTIFTIYVNGYDTATKVAKTITLSTLSPASSTATLICDAWRAQLAEVAGFSVAGSGTATLVLTAAAGLPYFTVSGDAATVNSIAGATTNVSSTLTISCANGTPTVFSVGTPTLLAAAYPVNQYPEIANLESASTYAEVDISYLNSPNGSSSEYANSVDTDELVVLIKTGVSNINDLTGAYGTITALKAGFKATIGARTETPTAAITVTTGAIALAETGGLFSAFDLRAGDYLLVGANYAAEVPTRIKITTSDTAGIGSDVTSVSAAVFRPVTWRLLTS